MASTPNQDTAQAWYLDVDGKPTGPYRLEQLKSFLQNGQIRPFHQVTAAHLNGRWISIHELVEAQSTLASAPKAAMEIPAKSAPFHPPPRPAEIDHTPSPVLRDESDAAHSLFTALQASKDRKAAALPVSGLKGRGKDQTIHEENSTPPWMIMAVIIGVGVAGWAAMKFFSHEPPPTQTKTHEVARPQPAPYTPPVAAQPAAPVMPVSVARPAAVSPIVVPPQQHNSFVLRQAPPPPVRPAAQTREDRDRDDRDREEREKEREEHERDRQYDQEYGNPEAGRGDEHGDSNRVQVANPPAGDSGARLEAAPNPRPVRPVTIDPYNPQGQEVQPQQ